jgi:hypothetical protein
MGGRAAEQLTCEALSTGAVDDIRRATDLAQRTVSVGCIPLGLKDTCLKRIIKIMSGGFFLVGTLWAASLLIFFKIEFD